MFDVLKMLLDHAGDFLHRFELRADRVPIPLVEIFPGEIGALGDCGKTVE